MKILLLQLLCLHLSMAVSAASQWEQRADFGGVGRHRTTGISIGNRAYMGLGHFNGNGVETYFSDWWEYDPSTNSWTQKVDYPANGGNGELGAHGIGLELVGYVGLGEIADYKLYKFVPATNTWTEVTGPPSGGSFQDTGDFTIGHKAYFSRASSTQLWEYDADLDTWTEKNPLPFTTFYSFSGFALNGKGYMKISNGALTLNEFWEYTPATDSWVQKAPFPGYARLSSISFVQNGKGYIVCGYGPGNWSDLTDEVWEYDPNLDSWSPLPEFPGTSRRYSTGITIGGRCYLGTGTNGTNFNDFWEFNAVAGQEELTHNKLLNVYPNPAAEFIYLEGHDQADLLDVQGKVMLQLKNGKNSIEGLSAGTYFVSVPGEHLKIIFSF